MNKNDLPKKAWTVLIYMAADEKEIEVEVDKDLNLIKKIGSNDDVNIVVQCDRFSKNSKVDRLYLKKGGEYEEDIQESLPETNTGDPNVLLDFIKWVVTNYPAQHYLLIWWGHGTGTLDYNYFWKPKKPTKNLPVLPVVEAELRGSRSAPLAQTTRQSRGAFTDVTNKDQLNNNEIEALFREVHQLLGRKLDIIGADMCQMGMLEVGYLLRESVDFLVASQALTPFEGWPYDFILESLTENPKLTPRQLSTTIINHYIDKTPIIKKRTEDLTLSAFDLSHLDSTRQEGIVKSVNQLALVMLGLINSEEVNQPAANGQGAFAAIRQARVATQSFGSKVDPDAYDYVDLFDFCDHLEKNTEHASLQEACYQVKSCFKPNGFVFAARSRGKLVENARGLSIYFPEKVIKEVYNIQRVSFLVDTKWDTFITTYLRKLSSN